jgi:hypothetical protein
MEERSTRFLFGGGVVPTPSITAPNSDPYLLDVNATTSIGLSKEEDHTSICFHAQQQEGRSGGVPSHNTTTRRLVSRHLLRAVELNYKGVCLLKSGRKDEEQAITVLKQSLACVKSDLSPEDSSAASTTAPNRTEANASWSRGHSYLYPRQRSTKRKRGAVRPLLASTPPEDDRPIAHDSFIVPVQVHESNSLDDNLYVFTKAFVFQLCGGYNGEPRHQADCLGRPSSFTVDTELLSATIIYNIGLALHIKAMRTKCVFLQKRSLAS